MKTKEAIQYFGSPENLKAALHLRARKTFWGEHPPLERQYQIEVITNGALKADRPVLQSLSERRALVCQTYLGAERRRAQRTNQERPSA
ncbi:MAG TPA: Cro/CI family transcriptional regulator [Methylophilaceae bacterium]